jgi:hypothetical protein
MMPMEKIRELADKHSVQLNNSTIAFAKDISLSSREGWVNNIKLGRKKSPKKQGRPIGKKDRRGVKRNLTKFYKHKLLSSWDFRGMCPADKTEIKEIIYNKESISKKELREFHKEMKKRLGSPAYKAHMSELFSRISGVGCV